MPKDELSRGARNPGVDLLRVVAMGFMVVLHALGQGGVLACALPGPTARTAWAMEALCFCAVDIFALISGYVGFSPTPRRTRLSAWLLLWLETAFYAVALTVVFCLAVPGAVTWDALRGKFFPLRNNLYWYFTAYTGLFFLKPLLDAGLRALSEKSARRVFLAVFAVFSVFDTCFHRFELSFGYSFAWIALVYVLGAAMRKCGIGARLKTLPALCCIAVLTVASWAWQTLLPRLPEVLWGVELLSYTSPTVLACAVCFLLVFTRLRPGKRLSAVIGFTAPGAYAVYLCNTHPLVWDTMEQVFAGLAERPAAVMAAAILGFAVCFTVCTLLIDKLRQLAVKALRIPAAAEAVAGFVTRWADALAEKL